MAGICYRTIIGSRHGSEGTKNRLIVLCVGRRRLWILVGDVHPSSLSREADFALDAHAGEQKMWQVMTEGEFTRFRRATEVPINRVFEAGAE
ncbi:MAG: hypothetical protein ABI856_14485 [Nitrospira sp.]